MPRGDKSSDGRLAADEGGKASAKGPAAERLASAKNAAATRTRNSEHAHH